MAKNRILLLNGCSRTEIKVTPKNWDKKNAPLQDKTGKPIEWVIWYRFIDPNFLHKHSTGKKVQIRGMNDVHNLVSRQERVRLLIAQEVELIDQRHFNPITKTFMTDLTLEKGDQVVKRFVPQYVRGKGGDTTKGFLKRLEGLLPEPEDEMVDALWLALLQVDGAEGTISEMGSIIRGVEDAINSIRTVPNGDKLDLLQLPVNKVQKKHITSILTRCASINKRWSDNRFNRYRGYLLILFSRLVKAGVISQNPITDIDIEVVEVAERRLPTMEERKTINDHLYKNHYHFWRFVQVFFHSGAREVELNRLQDIHIDLKQQRYKVLVKKRKRWVWVWKPIKDIVMPIWVEILTECSYIRASIAQDYPIFLFSNENCPGTTLRGSDKFTKYWCRVVKKELGINIDLYSLKHTHTTEIVDYLEDEITREAQESAALFNSHTSTAMVRSIYDVKSKNRQLDRIRKAGNKFA